MSRNGVNVCINNNKIQYIYTCNSKIDDKPYGQPNPRIGTKDMQSRKKAICNAEFQKVWPSTIGGMERREEKKIVGQRKGRWRMILSRKPVPPELSAVGIFNPRAKHTNREEQFFLKKNEWSLWGEKGQLFCVCEHTN